MKWSPPKAYIPKRSDSMGPLREHRTPRSTPTTFAPGFHFNTRDEAPRGDHFPEDEISSPTSSSNMNVQNLPRSLRRQHSFGIAVPVPKMPQGGPSQWHSIELSRKTPSQLSRQQSWSPSKTVGPFMEMSSNSSDAKERTSSPSANFKLQPKQDRRVSPRKKENRAPDFDEFAASLASMSLVTEHGESDDMFATPKLSPTESSSDDSSSAWLDFSLDGSENPFQVGLGTTIRTSRKESTSRACFSPIEKAAPMRRGTPIMTVKPAPVQRTKSCHGFYPSQHSRQPRSCHVATETSAFVSPTRTKSRTLLSPTHQKGDYSTGSPRLVSRGTPARRASTPMLAPSPKDVEPIIFAHSTGSDNSTKSEASSSRKLLHLSKYSKMLNAAVSFEGVVAQMERDGVDAAIIELATAVAKNASNH